MKIALLQFNPKFGEKEKNVDRALSMLQNVSFDLAVLPELFATGYLFCSKNEIRALSEAIPDGFTTKRLQAFARDKNVFLAYGILEKEGSKYYNAAVLLGPRKIVGQYRKLQLFAEEKKWFSPGNLPLSVHTVRGAKIGMMICYDWRFPEICRSLTLKKADIILHPSNLVLPHGPESMKTRALENRVFCVTVDRTGAETRGGKSYTYIGQSQVVDPDGNLLLRLGRTEETVGVVEIDPKKARNKILNPYNQIIKERRTRFYQHEKKLPTAGSSVALPE